MKLKDIMTGNNSGNSNVVPMMKNASSVNGKKLAKDLTMRYHCLKRRNLFNNKDQTTEEIKSQRRRKSGAHKAGRDVPATGN